MLSKLKNRELFAAERRNESSKLIKNESKIFRKKKENLTRQIGNA